MTTKTLNQEQVNELLHKFPMRTECRPSTEEYAVFAPLREEWERLNSMPEASRSPWQEEAHAELFAKLITDYWSPWYQWSKLGQSDRTFAAAAAHNLKQYRQ